MLRCAVLLLLILWIKVCSAYYGAVSGAGQTLYPQAFVKQD